MSDVQELFRLATQSVAPDPEALERQRRGQRRRSLRRKAEVYALVSALIVVGAVFATDVLRSLSTDRERPGTAPPSPGGTEQSPPTLEERPPTADRLEGVWLMQPDWDLMIRFGRDGTFAFIPDGYLGGSGTYEVKGDTIRFTYTGGRFCSGAFTWEAAVFGDGRLHTVNLESTSPCEPEREIGLETDWIRVSPSSPAAEQLTAQAASDSEQLPLESPSLLPGVWLLEGRGVLLRLGWGGSYAIGDDGELFTDPDDEGTFEVDSETGAITFTSAASSRTCVEGDRWVWANAELRTDPEYTVRRLSGFATEDACARGLGPDLTWFRLQDVSA